MPDETTIDEVDRDGAISEAQEALRTTTRGSLFRRAGLLFGGGIVAAAVPIGIATSQGGGLSKGDIEILNYALTLEELESAFYVEANENGRLSGVARTFAEVVGAHEAAHVAALRQVLGSQAKPAPTFDFKGSTNDKITFLKTAQTLEDTGVAAYQGQAGRIKSPEVLASAGAILAVEARHAAWVREILGDSKAPSPAPEAFSTPKSMKAILDAVGQTGFIKS